MTSLSQKVLKARKVLGEYRELEKMNDTLYWRRAERVFALKQENLWKFAYGESGAKNWASFCYDELNMPVSTLDQKAACYEFFIKKHGFEFDEMKPYDTHTLYYVVLYRPKATRKEVEKLLNDSLHMRRADLIATLRGEECPHDHTHIEEEEKVVCDICSIVVIKKKKQKNGKSRA